jgi:hypothetical protein
MDNIQKTTKFTEEISWKALEAFSKKIPNPQILAKYGEKVYNHEPYALEYYEKVILEKDFDSKEPYIGDCRKIYRWW